MLIHFKRPSLFIESLFYCFRLLINFFEDIELAQKEKHFKQLKSPYAVVNTMHWCIFVLPIFSSAVMEIENLSKDDLEKLIKKAQDQIIAVENKSLDDGYLQMLEIAKGLGLSILELNEHGENRKLNKKVVVKTEPKYRNKANPDEVWTGRGKRPLWLNREIESGKKLEDFLIV